MQTDKNRHAPPKASAMIEALRGLGYSTATALADIIDNSISAGASRVDVTFAWAGAASTVSVLDDGTGMDAAGLDTAMRLGEINPLTTRAPADLGRFGLGLKTASFSQCRRLTVASRRGGDTNCLRWDLDVLANSSDDGWYLLEGPDPGSVDLLAPLTALPHGTLVLWETLDRIITPGYTAQAFLDLIDAVERHLAMVFHRFIGGPHARLRLLLNGSEVAPWDPFLRDHPATWTSPVAPLRADGDVVEVRCHVLPHRDRLSADAWERAAGPDGWTAQQGFYVYRNQRLLVAGSWLGLGRGRAWTKEESHRLARIRLDIPNTLDAAWKIDIRKSTARPPQALRERLQHLAEDTRARARRVFAHRGQPTRASGREAIDPVWQAEHFSAGLRYRIDRKHPAVQAGIAGTQAQRAVLEAMLRVIEETVPIQRIWLDTAENHETPRTGFAAEPPEALAAILAVLYSDLLERVGLSPELARRRLARTEPFSAWPALIDALPDHPVTTE